MSRHRNVRAMNIDEEYDGYYDSSAYSQSVEDEFCISPRTEAQFLYNRDAQNHSMSAFLDASPDSHMDEYGGSEDGPRVRCDSMNERPNLSSTDRAKLQSCVEAMQNVVGDTISESILIKAATEHRFDLEKALDAVLSGSGVYERPKPPRSQNATGTKKEFCIHRKCASPNNIGGASKNNHHCKCNIKPNGYLGHPSICDPLILDLLKMCIAFIEFFPILKKQYSCELNSGNGFSTHSSSFYSLLVPLFTEFCSSNVFTCKYCKILRKLHLLNADFKNELGTEELVHNGNVVNQKFITKVFHCISKPFIFFLKLLDVHSAVTKSFLFSNEELSHLTQILQIFQSHLPVTVLHSFSCIPSSNGLQWQCKNNRIANIAVPVKCSPSKQKCDTLPYEKSDSLIQTFASSVPCHGFVVNFLHYKIFCILHRNQHALTTGLSLPETDYTKKKIRHMMCRKENIYDCGNIHPEASSYLSLYLLKWNILKSLADVNTLQTAMQRMQFNTRKCNNSYNCKYELQPFYTSVEDLKDEHHVLLKSLNFIQKYFSMRENESMCISYVLLPDGTCFETDKATKLRLFQPKNQLLVRNPSLNFSKEVMDVLSEGSVFLLQRHVVTKHLFSHQYEKTINNYSNGKFAFCRFGSTAKNVIWMDGAEGDYLKTTESADCKFMCRTSSIRASSKVLFECAESLCHVRGYYDSLQGFLVSNENPLLGIHLRISNNVDSGTLYFTNCCKSTDISESPNEVVLVLNKLSLLQEHSQVCYLPVRFSSFMKNNVSSALLNCSCGYTSVAQHSFLDHIALNGKVLLRVAENVNMCAEALLVASEYVKTNIMCLNCTLQSEKGSGKGFKHHTSSHECNTDLIFHNCLADLRCLALSQCDSTHDVNNALTSSDSLNCQELLPLCLMDDHICCRYHGGGDVWCTKLGMETRTNKTIPSVRNLNQFHLKLNLPDVKCSDFYLSIGDPVKFEDLITTVSKDTKSTTIGSYTSLNADLAGLSVLGSLSSETSGSTENCSDTESCDDLSLDDLFSSLNSDSIESILSDNENYSVTSVGTGHIDTGQDCGVGNKLLHIKTDSTTKVGNNISLSDLDLSLESLEVDDNSMLSFEDKPQEPILSNASSLENSSSPEKFASITDLHTPLNVVHSDEDFNTECMLINGQCRGNENVHLKIQSPVLSESWDVKHGQESVELGAYCCIVADSFNCDSDVQKRLTTEDKQFEQSDNLLSGHSSSRTSEMISNQCCSTGCEQQSHQHSLLSECGFVDPGDIFNEKNMPECMQFSDAKNNECLSDFSDKQNDPLNKSLSDTYLSFMRTCKNSDFECTSSELPSLSILDSHNTERSNVHTECSLVVQNEVSAISPLNGNDNSESQNFGKSNLEFRDIAPCSLSDLIDCENSFDILKNSDLHVLQNNWSSSDIFHSPQNCVDNVTENLSGNLSFLNSFNNNTDDVEVPQVLNSDTEQTSFPNVSLSDLYLGNKFISSSPIGTSVNASHLSCTPFSSVYDERTEISKNLLENECYSSPVLCADLTLTADSAMCETVEQIHPIENISFPNVCFKIQTGSKYPSKCLDGDELPKGTLLDCYSIVKSEKETKEDCDISYAEFPSVSLSELYNNVKPKERGQENHCTYAKGGGLSSPSFANPCFDLQHNDASKSLAEKSTKASSSLLDLYINSESDKYFDTEGSASSENLASDHHNNECTIIDNMGESVSDYFGVASGIYGQDHEIDEVDSKNSISEDCSVKKVSGLFDDDDGYNSLVSAKRNNTPVHQTSLSSPEFVQQTLQHVVPHMRHISEPVDQDHLDALHIDLSVAQKHPNSCPADFCLSDISLTNKKLSSSNYSYLKRKSPISSGSQESEIGIKTKKSLFVKVLKCTSKPVKSHTSPRPPRTLPEILGSIGYTKYFQFTTPSPDDVIKIGQKGTAASPGSSSTIKPPNLETVEDEKEFTFNKEVSGRMIISNGDIKTPDEFESATKVPAVPGETECKKAVEKSDVLQSSTDEDKGKNDEQSSTSPAVQLTNLKIDANDKEVVEAYKKERAGSKPLINLVVIGHVDAGKSTLMGHLLYRLGCVAKKMMHKYEQDSKKLGKSSFMYAWVLDETSEERNRGITMDVAQSKFETPHRSVTLLDAPGHKDFIPNMITGAAQADVAVLVLDSTRGEFETGFEAGGQTREHTMLIRSLGVSQLAVAVNKLDNVNWDKERYKEIVSKLSAFLKQAGFKESEVQFVPCSGLTGENLIKPPETPELKKWYSGPCLVDVIDSFKPPERPVSKPFRFCISDVFKGMGSGFCVSGRIEAGYVQNGDKVLVMPAAEQATVKGITIDETTVQHSFAGDHVTLQLSGVDMNNVTTGCVVCDIARPVKVSARFQARLVIFNITVPITKGFPVVLHYQSMSEQAFVKKLISQLHRSTGQVVKKRPRCLTKNSSAVVEIEVVRPICLEVYKDFKELGRFMLRSGGSTIAAGLVTEIL